MFGDQSFESIEVENFFAKIDSWIEGAVPELKVDVDIEEIESIMNISDFTEYSYEELMAMAFSLYSYIHVVQSEYNHCRAILDFCTESLWYITANDNNKDINATIAKWEEKYYQKVKRNPLAVQLNKLKMYASAKVTFLGSKVEHMKRSSEIITDIAKRRRYESG